MVWNGIVFGSRQTTWRIVYKSFYTCYFPAERKVVPWSSQSPAILSKKVSRTESPTIGNSEAESDTLAEQPAVDEKHGSVRVARQFVLKKFTQHPLLATGTSNGLLTIKPKQLFPKYHLVTAVNGIMEVSQQRHVYIYVSNSPRKSVRFPKHTVTAQTTELPTAIHAIYNEPHRCLLLRISEEHNQDYPIAEENATSRIPVADDVAAVHYYPALN